MSIQDQVVQGLIPEVSLCVEIFWACDFAGKCQSEIEKAFAATVLLNHSIRGVRFGASKEHAVRDKVLFFLEPQFKIGEYRVDFLMGTTKFGADDMMKCIAIECDGHDFHDKTKEQAARDKSRDRFLSGHVGRVIRFTGSEIYRDPSKCAIEALKIMRVVTFGIPDDVS